MGAQGAEVPQRFRIEGPASTVARAKRTPAWDETRERPAIWPDDRNRGDVGLSASEPSVLLLANRRSRRARSIGGWQPTASLMSSPRSKGRGSACRARPAASAQHLVAIPEGERRLMAQLYRQRNGVREQLAVALDLALVR